MSVMSWSKFLYKFGLVGNAEEGEIYYVNLMNKEEMKGITVQFPCGIELTGGHKECGYGQTLTSHEVMDIGVSYELYSKWVARGRPDSWVYIIAKQQNISISDPDRTQAQETEKLKSHTLAYGMGEERLAEALNPGQVNSTPLGTQRRMLLCS